MHVYLENTRDGERAYHVTSGVDRVECRYGPIGGMLRLSPPIDLKGKSPTHVMAEIIRKKTSASGGYCEESRSDFSLDQLSADVLTFRVAIHRLADLRQKLKRWEWQGNYFTLSVNDRFELAMGQDGRWLRLGCPKDMTSRLVEEREPTVSATTTEMLYLHQTDPRAPFMAALVMAGLAEVETYSGKSDEWYEGGGVPIRGHGSPQFQAVWEEAKSTEDWKPLLRSLGMRSSHVQLLGELWTCQVVSSLVVARAVLL